MAAEEIPAVVYLKGGQMALTGFNVMESTLGFEEDGEAKHDPAGRFASEITYSRRLTASATCDALTGADVGDFMGGKLVLTAAFQGVTDWEIRNATASFTRGPQVLTLDLIALEDELA